MSPKNSSKGSTPGLQISSSGTKDTPRHLEKNITDDKDNASIVSTAHSKLKCCGTCLRSIRLELLAVVFTISYVMTIISSTTMIMDKVCLVHLGYPHSICNNLDNMTAIKKNVTKLATNYQLGHSLIQIAPAAVLSCFLGPWSDHYGRKLPIMLAIVGMIINAVGSTICAYFLETRVEYYFIPAIFTGIFGGPASILAVFYCYATDCTPQMVQRTMKFAIIDMAAGFAIPIGTTAGGWIYKFYGYTPVFFISIAGLCLSLIIVVFLLEETRGLDNNDNWSIKLKTLFSSKSLVESFQAIIKARPHQGRKQIILLIISMCFIVITLRSTGDINYMYVHTKFGWKNTAYSNITSIYSVIGLVVLLIVVPLIKRFKIGDPYLGLIGSASLLGKNIGISLAWSESVYHIAQVFGILGSISAFAARSRISKVVSKEDLGKVFSFVAASEAILPILTGIVMSQLFAAFLDTFMGMPYLTLSAFLVLPVAVFSWIKCLPEMSDEEMSHNQKTEEAIEISEQHI